MVSVPSFSSQATSTIVNRVHVEHVASGSSESFFNQLAPCMSVQGYVHLPSLHCTAGASRHFPSQATPILYGISNFTRIELVS